MRILAFLVALAGVGFGAWNYYEAQQALRVARAAVKLAEELEAANKKGSEVAQVVKHLHHFCAEKGRRPEFKGLCGPEARDS